MKTATEIPMLREDDLNQTLHGLAVVKTILKEATDLLSTQAAEGERLTPDEIWQICGPFARLLFVHARQLSPLLDQSRGLQAIDATALTEQLADHLGDAAKLAGLVQDVACESSRWLKTLIGELEAATLALEAEPKKGRIT